jgi:hypothetical protein
MEEEILFVQKMREQRYFVYHLKTKQEMPRQHKRVKCEKKSRISTENVNNK